ncbi:MAG: adenylosuccinate synthase [Planctomycetes bacterium]|nr:adenylosuccinate synthase [Planctomycetota bacterium]
MSITCVIGLQWGDEGKGKIVDLLSRDSDYVVRYQGGSNAGHTVVLGKEKFVLHIIPSGILHPGVKCVIANGVVFDPRQFLGELDGLKKKGIRIKKNLYISDRAHLVFPYHKAIDGIRESRLGKKKIGTTGLGIGPCYSDKFARTGIRVIDLFNPALFKERLQVNLSEKNVVISAGGGKPLSTQDIYQQYLHYARQIKPYVTDTRLMLEDALRRKKRILLEGAQGSLLDIDFGTYPFVTSSNADACGISSGAGISARKIDKITGVLKAYATRVGEGPFPTELNDALGENLRRIGGEYGATTGRPRRCGWLDLVAAKYSAQLNDIDSIAITKLDVLSHLKKIKVAVAYKYNGKTIHEFPAAVEALARCRPVYRELPGWQADISGINRYNDLSVAARKYLDFISQHLGVPIGIVSVGAERKRFLIKR